MFDVSRILAIPELEPDKLQMGLSNTSWAVIAASGKTKDGSPAKASVLKQERKGVSQEDIKKAAEKVGIKGDKKFTPETIKPQGKHRVTGKDTYLELGSPNKYGEHPVNRVMVDAQGKKERDLYTTIKATPENSVKEIFDRIASEPKPWVKGYQDIKPVEPKPSPSAASTKIPPETAKKVKKAKDQNIPTSKMSQQSNYSSGLASIGNGLPNNPKAIEAWANKHNVSLDDLIKEYGSGLTPQAAKKNSPEFLALLKAFYNDKPFVAPKKKTPKKSLKKTFSEYGFI